MKTLNERIAEKEARLAAIKDETSELVKSVEEGEDLTEDQTETLETLNAEFENVEKQLEGLRKTEENLKKTINAPAVVKAKHLQAKEVSGMDLMTKLVACHLKAHIEQKSIDQVAAEMYPKMAQLEAITKATVQPADTTTTGWAAELVQTMYADFLENLTPMSFFQRLAARGIQLNFGRSRTISLPAAGTPGGLAGSFVKEGALIPVKKMAFSAVTMAAYKMAVISDFTREIAEASTPAIEPLIRDNIVRDTAAAIDAAAISNAAAVTGVSPAGLLNGVTATASAGTTTANIITDIKALVNPLLAGNNNMGNVVLLMNEAHLLGLSLATTAAGNFMFPSVAANGTLLGYPLITSNNIPVGTVVAIAADNLASAMGAMNFRVSDTATLVQADDTAVKPDIGDHDDLTGHITDGTNAAVVKSLYQQDLIAVRMIMDLSWALRRPASVQALSGVAW
jgi:HK97 family phage major capsid protein